MLVWKRVAPRLAVASFIVVAAAAFLPVKRYVAPQGNEPAATLVVMRTVENSGESQSFSLYEDFECAKSSRSGFLGALSAPLGGVIGGLSRDRDRLETPVVANQTLYVRARANEVIDSRRHNFKSRRCLNIASFTPLEGRQYEVRQVLSEEACMLVIFDIETQRLADDWAPVPVSGRCND